MKDKPSTLKQKMMVQTIFVQKHSPPSFLDLIFILLIILTLFIMCFLCAFNSWIRIPVLCCSYLSQGLIVCIQLRMYLHVCCLLYYFSRSIYTQQETPEARSYLKCEWRKYFVDNVFRHHDRQQMAPFVVEEVEERCLLHILRA